MSVPETTVQELHAGVVVNVPLAIDMQTSGLPGEVYVFYGSLDQLATQGVDYTIDWAGNSPALPGADLSTFNITPLAPLMAKIALNGTNQIKVRRTLALTTDFDEEDAHRKSKIVAQFDRVEFKLQQLDFEFVATANAAASAAAAAASAGAASASQVAAAVSAAAALVSAGNALVSANNAAASAALGAVNVKASPYNAVGDGIANDTAAIAAALAAALATTPPKPLYFPAGTYLTSLTLTLTKSGCKIFGDGNNASTIMQTTAATPVITVNGFLTGVNIEHLCLDRNIPATAGGQGVYWTDSTADSRIRHCIIQNQSIGLYLTVAGNSYVEDVTVQKCYSHGVYMTNTPASGALGWLLVNVFSLSNDGSGFLVATQNTGPAQATCANVINCSTFGNSGYGFGAIGLATIPIQAIRLYDCFFGGDGPFEVYMDTWGTDHVLDGVFVEQAGTQLTGRTHTTAPATNGYGFRLTTHNENVQFSDCIAQTSGLSGWGCAATRASFTGCCAMANGIQAVAGNAAGINVLAGKIIATGCRLGNDAAFVPQVNGIVGADGTGQTVISCDFTGNTGAKTAFTANNGLVSLFGCTGGAATTYAIDSLLDLSAAPAGQIKFPAAQNASANVNTLDDYEEGTWTPAMTFGGSATGITYSVQVGSYIKIGKLVFVRGEITLTNNGSGAGIGAITGLPFTSAATIPGALAFPYYSGCAGVVGNIVGNINAGATAANLFMSGAAAAAAATDAIITNTADLFFSGCYEASA